MRVPSLSGSAKANNNPPGQHFWSSTKILGVLSWRGNDRSQHLATSADQNSYAMHEGISIGMSLTWVSNSIHKRDFKEILVSLANFVEVKVKKSCFLLAIFLLVTVRPQDETKSS
jgi:hypothetical protein